VDSAPVVRQEQDWKDALAHYYPRVRGWYRHVLADPAAVDDLTQEVFVRLYDQLTKGEVEVLMNPWKYIKVMCKNVFLEHLKSQSSRLAVLALAEESTTSGFTEPAETYAYRQALEAVPQLLDQLPATHRGVLVGCYFLGLTAREMADAMGTTPSNIAHRHSRALCQLRKMAVEQGIAL
jgi:RNA polymerase sigma factor (sigma-70 family)